DGPEGRDPPGERDPGEDGRRGRGRGPHRGASVGRRRHPVPGGREGAAADALIQSLLSLPFIKSPRVRPAPAACFFTAIGWTRSLSLIPSCRSNFRTRSSPGVIVPDSSFAITLARSLIFAPRSACFHPRDSRAWRIIWGKSSISSNSPPCAYTSFGVRRRWRASSRWAMTGGIVLGRNGALDTSSPKRAHSPHTARTVASIATLFSRRPSAAWRGEAVRRNGARPTPEGDPTAETGTGSSQEPSADHRQHPRHPGRQPRRRQVVDGSRFHRQRGGLHREGEPRGRRPRRAQQTDPRLDVRPDALPRP